MRYLIFLICFFNFNIHSHEYIQKGIKIEHPVLKVITAESKVGAGYMKIINNSEKDVKLIKIQSDIAKTQEIHEVITDKNVYKMRPIDNGIIIKSSNHIDFKPKSYHFMFFNINNTVMDGEMLNAKLIFKNNIIIPIKFKVVIGNHNKIHEH